MSPVHRQIDSVCTTNQNVLFLSAEVESLASMFYRRYEIVIDPHQREPASALAEMPTHAR
jgi:hypothetical protein